MTTEQLGALDLAFLCLEDGAAPLHLGGVAIFDEGVDGARLAALLRDRVRHLPRMRQQVQISWLPTGGGVWVEDPEFRVDQHIHVHQLPLAALDDVAALAAEVMAEPLDLAHPPWQLHVVSGLAGGRVAIVAKLHHALCDGLGALGLTHGLFDGGVPSTSAPARHQPGPAPSVTDRIWNLISRPDQLVATAVTTATSAVSQARTMLDIGSSVLREARPPAPSPLLAAPSPTRRVILTRLPMSDVRRVRRQYGGTTHDVLLAIISGALRHWLVNRGHPVADLRVRALIPASQRRRSTPDSGGNQLSGYLCDLPVAEPRPARQLDAIRTTMDRNKATGPQHGAGALPVIADLLPPAVHRFVTPLARHAAPLLFDVVVTTVPLPAMPLHLAGSQLRELYPLVPLAHGHSLGIALSPHHDTVHIGLHANREALPDIAKLHDALPAALTALADAATH